MSDLPEQIMYGLSYGSLLMLMAVGLTLIFGVGRVVNFAHGAALALGALLTSTFIGLAAGFWVSLLAVPAIVAIAGYGLDVGLIRRLRNQPLRQFELQTLLVTYGVALVVHQLLASIWGHSPRVVDLPSGLGGAVDLPLVGNFSGYRLFALGLSIAVVVGVFVLLRKTAWGRRVRASADDVSMAEAIGIKAKPVMSSAFAIGVGMAGLAGALAAPLFTAFPQVGDNFLVQAFVAVVLGGLGSLYGAVVAALGLGVVISIAQAHIDVYATIVPLGLVAIVLIARPNGLFGSGAN